MTLVIGVRSNDVGGNAITDLASLVHIHDDPADQPAHCIRRTEDDGSAGNASALDACRAFILEQLAEGGLLDDVIDTATTELVPVFLAFRGRVELSLPRYVYRLGRALHALEDGYAHALRNPISGEVRSVLNWIDLVSDDYDEAVDGHGHLFVTDDCRRANPYEQLRVAHTTNAATALLAAIADPTDGGAGRRARVEAALAAAFAIEPGCEWSNRYCNAEELDERVLGCSIGGGGSGLVMLLIVVTSLTRRRAWPIVIGVALAATPARADREKYVDARLGASLDRAALAGSIGAGVRSDSLSGGIAIEWNPWFSLDIGRASAGCINLYATGAYRWFDHPYFSLYTRVELGTSTMLFELVGVDKYQTGMYLGASLLGVALKRGSHWRFTIDPSHFAMPMPLVTSSPYFYYRQYRITVGVERRF